ncbi:MAG: hypothetical protein NBV67_05310 [Tagaea sp.]|nr:hypothetical protein [Tagaea sp.]
MHPNLLEQDDPRLAHPAPQTGPGRPDYVPEKFWNAQRGAIESEALARAYGELERKMSGYVPGPSSPDWQSTVRRSLGVPDAPDGYQLKVKDDLLQVDPDVNARLHAAGFSPAQAQLVYDLAVERMVPMVAQFADQSRAEQQLERLVEEFGGQARWNSLANQLAGWGRANLSPEVYAALASSPDGIRALRKLMESGEPMLSGRGGTPAPVTEAELRQIMKDKRYWKDRDPEIVRIVTEGFERLYPERP